MLAGPTAVGKGTVAAEVRDTHPEVWISVSATRRPRPGEEDGVHYWFVADEEFDRMVADGELLEWALVHQSARYGAPPPRRAGPGRGPPRHAGDRPAGRAPGRETMPEALFVFLKPPSWDELVRRLVGRGTESAEERALRLDTARLELPPRRSSTSPSSTTKFTLRPTSWWP